MIEIGCKVRVTSSGDTGTVVFFRYADNPLIPIGVLLLELKHDNPHLSNATYSADEIEVIG